MTLSVVVITRNEVDVIGRCLESVAWADETIVLDSAKRRWHRLTSPAGLAQRSKPRPIGRSFGPQKTVALAFATGSWVLSIDADEW